MILFLLELHSNLFAVMKAIKEQRSPHLRGVFPPQLMLLLEECEHQVSIAQQKKIV
jgi:hypothetical protein